MANLQANKPMTPDGKTYHLVVREGDLAPYCFLPGSPERAQMIAETMFEGAIKMGDHRGLRSFTGRVQGIKMSTVAVVKMSVVNTGMGCPTTGIVLPEAVCGAKGIGGHMRLIRVGSCSAIQPEPVPGDSVICTGAVRMDGASANWAPHPGYPAVADYRVVQAMVDAAKELGFPHHEGIEATTDCFVEGQCRPDINGYIAPRMQMLFDELVARNVLYYSMEASALFTWCTTHGKHFWAGAVSAVYGNRLTNTFDVKGDEQAAMIAVKAALLLQQRYPILEAEA